MKPVGVLVLGFPSEPSAQALATKSVPSNLGDGASNPIAKKLIYLPLAPSAT